MMFDELIVNAAAKARGGVEHEDDEPEVEIFEYRALRDQMTWLQAHFPTDAGFAGIDRPMLSSPEVITCDNTEYIHTHRDADRAGILLSVPFYSPACSLKGTISAIVRTKALVSYLPGRDHALINTGHAYRVMSSAPGVAGAAAAHVARAEPDPRLLFSAVDRLDAPDAQGRWLLWSGRPDRDFLSGDAAKAIHKFEGQAYQLIGLFALLAAAGLFILRAYLGLQGRNRELLQHALELSANEVKLLEQAKTQTDASEKRAIHLAYHDALTGLPNRAMLWDRLAHALDVSRRNGKGFAVHCIDLDQFKGVNDAFGHHVGDELIREAAALFTRICRKTDTLARLGGDEFAIVQMGATPANAAALADRVVALMAQPVELSVGQVHAGCSVGVTLIQDASMDPLEALRQADLALYRAKADGRGRYAFFEPEMDAAVRTRRALQADLKLAMSENALTMAYQPQVNSAGAVVGVEALVRWRHPERGMVPPSLFIPIAEECGLIVELGFFTMRRAFQDSRRWPSVKVAINVSAHQLRMPDFVGQVQALVRETAVSPARFELELTEGVLMGDDPATHETLQALRDLGFSLALDDFGTGYSSLSYLQRYPIDKIKIDRSFIMNLGDDSEASAVVAAIVKLAGALNLRVIAEGVETKAQRDALSAVGCSEVQGFLTGRPMTAEAVDDLLNMGEAGHRAFAKAS